ncbi:MAG: (deoxy)nucleoside triphosphate pyrophosphohydrolase [Pseudobdellovibrionaceae bacterium]
MSFLDKKRVQVVGAIFERDSTFALFKKNNGSKYDGLWEFPGGKPEEGELPQETLVREIKEELGVDVRKWTLLGTESYEEEKRIIELTCFLVTEWSGIFQLTEHSAYEFVSKPKMPMIPMVPADILFIKYL